MMEEAKTRWLRPNEIHAVLYNHKHFSISVKPVNLPSSNYKKLMMPSLISLFTTVLIILCVIVMIVISFELYSLEDKSFFLCNLIGGTIVLFDRKMLRNFRKDGHNWKKKKDGKTVKEAHEHLKVCFSFYT